MYTYVYMYISISLSIYVFSLRPCKNTTGRAEPGERKPGGGDKFLAAGLSLFASQAQELPHSGPPLK